MTASGAALDHVDRYPLAFRQIGEAAAIDRRGMHENVLAADVPDDELLRLRTRGLVP